MVGAESPTDFYARRERCFEPRHGETDKTDKRRRAANLDGPKAKAVLIEIGIDARRQLVALPPRRRRGQKLINGGIGIQCGEGRQVGWLPTPKKQPFGLKFTWHVHQGFVRRSLN